MSRLEIWLGLVLVITLAGCADKQDRTSAAGRRCTPDLALSLGAQGSAIIGGDAVRSASDQVRRSTAEIEVLPDGLCSGTLISSDVVLTAAHCVEQGEPTAVAFAAGTCSEKMIAVDSFKAMPNEGTRGEDLVLDTGRFVRSDVAWIKLARPVPAPFAPTALGEPGPASVRGLSIIAAGYGLSDGSPTGSLFRMSATIRRQQDGVVQLQDTGMRSSICYGDSGGPWYHRGDDDSLSVVGLSSSGDWSPGNPCPPGAIAYSPDLSSERARTFLSEALARGR